MSKCNCGSNNIKSHKDKDKEDSILLDNIHYLLIAAIILLVLLIRSRC